MAQWSAKQGLGPTVVDHWLTTRYGILVMERWHMTLAQWKRQRREHVSLVDGDTDAIDEVAADGTMSAGNPTMESMTMHNFAGKMYSARDVQRQVTRIIGLAKRSGHRDIKDSNIVLMLDGESGPTTCVTRVGVIDWGKCAPPHHILREITP